jgi:hypothetical protein
MRKEPPSTDNESWNWQKGDRDLRTAHSITYAISECHTSSSQTIQDILWQKFISQVSTRPISSLPHLSVSQFSATLRVNQFFASILNMKCYDTFS